MQQLDIVVMLFYHGESQVSLNAVKRCKARQHQVLPSVATCLDNTVIYLFQAVCTLDASVLLAAIIRYSLEFCLK